MHPSQRRAAQQQHRVDYPARHANPRMMFNLLTGPQLLEQVVAWVSAHRERLYPPMQTLSMFVVQSLSPDGSCQQVVNDAVVDRLIRGARPGKTDTGAYGKARARLPLTLISSLTRQAGQILAQDAPG